MGGAHLQLWKPRSTLEEWAAHLDAYPERLEQLSKLKKKPDELADLDRWYRLELSKNISTRASGQDPPHLLPQELSDIMRWKLARGKFRPGLQGKADSNSEANTKAASSKGFAAAEAVQKLLKGPGSTKSAAAPAGAEQGTVKAIEALSKGPPKLAGIGPATASAVLAAFSPCFPFMSDEAAAAALCAGKLKYDLKEYVRFCSAVREKAAELNKAAGSDGKESGWTAVSVERALWSASQQQGDAGRGEEPEAGDESGPRKKTRRR